MFLILGKNGQLGQEFLSQWSDKPAVFLGSDQCDVTHQDAVSSALDNTKPDCVINCTAYTNVADAQGKHKNTCFNVNVNGVKILAQETSKRKIPLIHFSTDYIFDGTKNIPYAIDDIPNPINNYGLSKHLGEQEFLNHAYSGAIIRVAYLSSQYSHNIIKTFLHLLKTKGKINAVFDQKICITTTSDVVAFVDKLTQTDNALHTNKTIYHLASSGSCDFFELANYIKNLIQSKTIITPVALSDFQNDIKRPPYSVLDISKAQKIMPFPSWQQNVKSILSSMGEIK